MLSDRELYELATKQNLITPFNPENCEGATINLTLDTKVMKYKGDKPIIMGDELTRENYIEIDIASEEFELQPHEMVLIHSVEYVRIPENYSALAFERYSVKSLGLMISPGHYMNPGFEGKITLTAVNHNSSPIRLIPGIKICQLALFALSSPPIKPYGKQEAKYMGENDISISKLHLDREIRSYLEEHGIVRISEKAASGLSKYLMERIQKSAKGLLEIAKQEGLMEK